MNEFTVRLDLAKGKARQQQTVFVRQGDRNATTIVATIYDHGAAAATSGLTARFQMRLPNGTEYYRKAASLSGNVATVALDETQAASVAGRTDVAYFQLLQGSTVVASTESFTVVVLPDALADAEVAESYDSAIQDAIDALDAAVADMPETVETVLADHPEWTTTVQDGSISKAKLATDLARDRERLQYRLANLLTNALPEGETATASDAAKTPLAGLSLYGRSTQDGTPTPSAPVSIVSVAPDSQGNISLWARGRNLMPPTVYNLALISSNPSYIYGGSDYRGVWCACEPNTTYTFTRDTVSGNRLGIATTTEAPAQNVTCTIVVSTVTTPSRSKTFTTPADAKFVFVYLANDGSTITQDFALYRGTVADPYVPYTETATPIDLDGHELRSLPDGTRDELTVGADGHAVLIQRVGGIELDGSSDENWALSGSSIFSTAINTLMLAPASNNTVAPLVCSHLVPTTSNNLYNGSVSEGVAISTSRGIRLSVYGGDTTLSNTTEWLASNPTTLLYKLAMPVTHDLGTIDPVPLVGPDLTAQAIPTAPFALTYERDLNATLARLESAIAELATN